MENVSQQKDVEIDLLEWITTIWDGKWKIISIVAISVLGVFGFQQTQSSQSFNATTEVKPITSVMDERYDAFNAVGFFQITPTLLQNLYIEQLQTKMCFLLLCRNCTVFTLYLGVQNCVFTLNIGCSRQKLCHYRTSFCREDLILSVLLLL